ncbi:phytoene/squalene synthase family protein [Nocardia gamkensis]|uniref:Phytoene/squalene synthase family protein n=1 Tax=Nocardia gamkensis TaxID=352869 RepID=A0A7X6R178_9NOCA|nr:phytoene/squalene synthase family protein [Nocardia gamkensis]NKY24968.1 phytoene/squalene synthase family protein [Nocardia gamkensis]NQE66751.1 Phytoene synthase [Nocardia gamkensis]
MENVVIKRRHAHLLDASGINEPHLRSAYETCRQLHARFGKTYYLSTLLLPPAKRPYVHSLYGFARYADEIVDNGDPRTRERDMLAWSDIVLRDLREGTSRDPICQALLHTMHTWDIPVDHIEAFLASMLMDLTVTEYSTYADLRKYMYGSAAVIGLQMVPILEPLERHAHEHAVALGEAFQLTNFVRDVAEDLARGRVYLPLEDLDRFGVTRERLAAGGIDESLRELLRFEIDRIRKLYDDAEKGIDSLAESSRDCIRVALKLYRGIIEEVEKADYRVLDGRVRVGLGRRIRVAGGGYFRARKHFTV